jgi:RNA polymerase sigma-70 factor (ECF subfamily)
MGAVAQDELVTAFLGAWSGKRVAAPAELTRALHALCGQDRPAGLSDRELVTALAVHAPPDDVVGFVERCRVEDFTLATAAGRGQGAAIDALDKKYGGTLGFVARRFAGKGHTDEDLRQILRTKLFVREPDREPTIAAYNGQGSLESWLRVTATRLFIDLGRRKDRARETSSDPSDLDAVEPADLEMDLVKAEYRSAVAAAMDEAATQLEPGDRHLLRQHFVAGLTIDQLGAVLGVHRATAARRVAKARELLAQKTRELVAEQLSLEERELDEIFGLVASKLQVSIRRMLATKPAQ